ncbi:MAG TPA: NAD(P)/FAD-dependent oxidoreductase, partial [Candidatus Tectomicrobia bacterium]|nr:NAD(P)/FAD-dependent oxidoreductase [Candidatus Tectomicrobia bacterium]
NRPKPAAEPSPTPRVVIVGAGFAGLAAAKALRGKDADVLLVDRQNYHTFLPLLYEVAAAGLEPDDIAQPVRAILRGAPNIRFLMASVEGIDRAARTVRTSVRDVSYDYLVLAPGSVTNYFGLDSVAGRALGLKDLHEATAVRNRILRNFERATLETDPDEQARLMTMVVIGGGPTGVELAGALAELKRHVLPRDYPDLGLARARVVLVEALDHVLSAMPERLQRKAVRQLEQLGVEVRLGAAVADVSERGVRLRTGEEVPAANVVWVAGVRGDPLGGTLGAEVGPSRRVRVTPALHLPGDERVFVAGDLALLEGADGRPLPMMAPVAMQQGALAATNVLRAARGQPMKPFRYRDRGSMATVGRKMAVAHVFGLQFSGLIAWILWLFVHLLQLVGLRNRALVLVNWTWNYVRYDRANRLVTDAPARSGPLEATTGAGRAAG